MARLALVRSCHVEGIGLHTGVHTRVHIRPSDFPVHRFVREDLVPPVSVPALADNVVGTQLCTQLGVAGSGSLVATAEHLLAAMFGMGLAPCEIGLDGPEVPILDGSARPWVDVLRRNSEHVSPTAPSTREPDAIHIAEPMRCAQGDAFVEATPADRLSLAYEISFPGTAIGHQRFDWTWEQGSAAAEGADGFSRAIAPARTFSTLEAVERLRSHSQLCLGGDLTNALVCDGGHWLNPPLRFPNEPVRHKMLDLIGDLALCGRPLGPMHITAHRAGHALHVHLARKLLAGASRGPASPP